LNIIFQMFQYYSQKKAPFIVGPFLEFWVFAFEKLYKIQCLLLGNIMMIELEITNTSHINEIEIRNVQNIVNGQVLVIIFLVHMYQKLVTANLILVKY